MRKVRRLPVILAALLFVTCMTCATLFMFGAQAEETWTALNNDTTVSNGVIKAGNTADDNDYVAKYNQAIDLDNGFQVNFTVEGYQGYSNEAWDQFNSYNNIAFALTAGEASATAQNAYVFGYGAKSNGELRLYTYYTKDFKLQDGKISFTESSGYSDNTTRDGSFDTTVKWENLTEFSLAGDIVNGIPMFWMNGHAVNPFGNTVWGARSSSIDAMISKLKECYADFQMDTDALQLYAFNTSAGEQSGEFSVKVEGVSAYQATNAGWVAADTAAIETTANDVVFSDMRAIKDGGMSRTRFIYDHIFDLSVLELNEGIEFRYSMNGSVAALNAVTWVSVRGVGIDQFTSAKTVTPEGHYENFLWYGGPTIGIYNNSTNAQAFGLSSGNVTGTGADAKDGTWTTKTVWFGLTGPNNYSFKVNGATVSNYSKDDLVAVLGEDLKAEIGLVPCDSAAANNAAYKLPDFMKVITADETSAEYVSGAEDQIVSFNLTMPSDEIAVQKVLYNEEPLSADTDYTLTDNVLTLADSFMEALEPGSYTLTVVTNANTTLELNVRVLAAITFDFEDETMLIGSVKSMQDVVFSVVLGSDEDEVESVKLEDTEIEFIGAEKITIGADTLNKLHVGEYTVTVTTNLSYATFTIQVKAVAEEAPVWAEEQNKQIEIDLANATDVVLSYDLKDAVDYYLAVNGTEVTEAVFDTTAKTVTVPKAFIEKLSVGNNYAVLYTDGGNAGRITLKVSLSLGKWDVTSNEVQAPVMNENGEISMTGNTQLLYQENIDLSDGYSLTFRFDNVYDFDLVSGGYAEFNVKIEQGNVSYNLYIRTRDNEQDHPYALEMVQLHQLVYNGGELVANDVRTTPVAHTENNVWSIKLCGSTILTMFSHSESRENGLPLNMIGDQKFDNATITVSFNVRSCAEANQDITSGTLVSFGEFSEELKNIPAWAKSYFLDPLPSPVLTVDGNKVTWEAVAGAVQYLVYVNGEAQEYCDETEIDASNYGVVGDTVSIQVKAVGNSTTNGDSVLSAAVEVTIGEGNGGNDDGNGGCGSALTSSSIGLSFLLLVGAAILVFAPRKKEVH